MEPKEPPPPYNEATGSNQPSKPSTHLEVPHKTRNGIPPHTRRSMEDENRDLPHGWVRQYDAKEHHQFFVDTTADPPRSIWQHPYDDEQYMSSVSPEERSRIQGLHRVPTRDDIEAESSGDDHDAAYPQELPPRPTNDHLGGAHKFGRRLKDRITNSTHEEREQSRREREAQEQKAYEQHQRFRLAMSTAAETGIPQFLGKDREGKDVYIEAPHGPGPSGYGQGAYGYNPYTQGPYANPNARFVRPPDPYARPYGYGYGGGYGLPIGLGLGGGLLMGGLLF